MKLDEKIAKIQLCDAALAYTAQVQACAACADGDREVGAFESYEGASDFLATTALAYAGATGSLDAAERAELAAHRRFRDGVIALRGEFVSARTAEGEVITHAGTHAVETIDALLATSYPKIGEALASDDEVDPNKPTGGVHPRGIA